MRAKTLPVPSPACRLSSKSSWRKCVPCLSSAPNGPEGDGVTVIYMRKVSKHFKFSIKTSQGYLSESSSSNNLKGLEVVQAESRPLQPQKLSLLTGVLRAPHYFLQNTHRAESSEEGEEKGYKENKTLFLESVPPHLVNPLHPWPSPASSACGLKNYKTFRRNTNPNKKHCALSYFWRHSGVRNTQGETA